MEKTQEQKDKRTQKTNDDHNPKPIIWDCGSSLYDSFELKSFERCLDSAICSRTLSMPHLPHRQAHNNHAQPNSNSKPISRKSSRFSRSFHKLVKSVFGPKENTGSLFTDLEGSQDGFYFVYDKSGSLSAIPEVVEKAAGYGGGLHDSDESFVKKTASERFTASSVGITCAIFFR